MARSLQPAPRAPLTRSAAWSSGLQSLACGSRLGSAEADQWTAAGSHRHPSRRDAYASRTALGSPAGCDLGAQGRSASDPHACSALVLIAVGVRAAHNLTSLEPQATVLSDRSPRVANELPAPCPNAEVLQNRASGVGIKDERERLPAMAAARLSHRCGHQPARLAA